jgi:hypothetical protein
MGSKFAVDSLQLTVGAQGLQMALRQPSVATASCQHGPLSTANCTLHPHPNPNPNQ